MSDSFSLNCRRFATLDWTSLNGSQGLGICRLYAQIRITTDPTPEAETIGLVDISGLLRVSGKNEKNQHVGYIRRPGTNKPITTYAHGSEHSINFEMELENRRLDAIEEIRKGGDLEFAMNVSALAYCVAKKGSECVDAELKYPVNQSMWIKMLEQMGYRKTLMIEVPIQDKHIPPELAEAAKHLQQAQELMLYGKYRDAVGTCRDVVESLSTGLNDDQDRLPEEIEAWFEGQRTMSKEHRLRLVRRAVRVLTHPARHADKTASQIEWSSHDARAAIALVAALLQVAGGRNQ